MMRFYLLRSSLLLSLTACAVGQNYQPPTNAEMAMPDRFQHASSVDSPSNLSNWWQDWHDPTLTTLVETALTNNLDLKLAKARLEEVRARQTVSRANLFPSIATAASALAGGAGGSSQDRYSGDITISWLADLFGGTRRANEAAAADTEASVATLNATRIALIADVADTYIAWRGTQKRLDIATDNLTSQRETLQFINWRQQAGLVSQLEQEQAKTAVAQTEAQIPTLESAKTGYANQLTVLLGMTPGALDDVLLAKTNTQPPSGMTIGIPANVLRKRPDVGKAERDLAAATARVGEAESALYPNLTLKGSIGLEALNLPDILTGATISRSILGSLAATIFDAGQLRQQVAIKSAQQEQALLTYQSTLLTALSEVETTLVNEARLRERKTALARAATTAKTAADLAHAQYRAGTIDYQNVLETERTRLSTEDTLAVIETSHQSALITLYRALGGGWSYGTAP